MTRFAYQPKQLQSAPETALWHPGFGGVRQMPIDYDNGKRRFKVVVRRAGVQYSPPLIDPTNTGWMPPNPMPPISNPNAPTTLPAPGTTVQPMPGAAVTTGEDLLFGFPRIYVYVAGAGVAAAIVLYIATRK